MRITSCFAVPPRKNGNVAKTFTRFRLRLGRGAASERGGSLIEFALVLPLLMVVATGIFAFGIALNNYLELTNAVNIGAQLLAVSRGVTTPPPCTAALDALYNAAPYLAEGNLAVTFTFTNNGTSNAYTTAAQCDSAATETGSPIFSQGESVTLMATYPCTLVGYGFSFGCKLTANVTEIVQ